MYYKVFKQDYSDVTKKYVEDETGEKVANPKYIKHLGRIPNYQELDTTRKSLLDQSVKEKMNYGS